MSTVDLIAAAQVLDSPPVWRDEAISIRPMSDGATAAAELDKHAAAQGIVIGEVARVSRQGIDVIYARAARPTNPALEKAAEFGQFLDRAIAETKTVSMNKFAELAAKIKSSQEAMNAEADDLNAETDRTMSLFMAATSRHRSMLNDAKDGAKAMEEAAAAMAGHNEEQK